LKAQHLTPDEAAALNFEALLAFWHSPVGRAVCANASCAHRELPFTARFTAFELRDAGLHDSRIGEEEFVIVQGIVDLAIIFPEEIRIIDFKTDHIRRSELAEATEKYRPQLALYAGALNRIYRRPVSERWLHFLSLGETIRM
jgi:ATP-dependent helicase/nuclease subunit A